ncbi:MAG TPA: hypothetical protein PLQ35_06080 [bacterium]|nr:hypothetical protein [bacterium]HQL61846.1 hypothetical protein [bacterium]
MPRALFSTFFALLLTALVLPVSADEFDGLRDALKRAWEPFTHYSAEIHALTYQITANNRTMHLVGEATRTVEIQKIHDPAKGGQEWLHDLTEEWGMGQDSPGREYRRNEYAWTPESLYCQLLSTREPNGQTHYVGIVGQDVAISFFYPHAVIGRRLSTVYPAPDVTYTYSQPAEDYQGLPGMRMTSRSADITVWFSPEKDLFPIRCLYCAPQIGNIDRSIHTVEEFGTADYRGRSVYYPKNYTYEEFEPGFSTCRGRYVMEIRSIQFHEFDPQFNPTVTFPRGIEVKGGQAGIYEYRTFVPEDHPGGHWNSITLATSISYGALIALLFGIWLLIRAYDKYRS